MTPESVSLKNKNGEYLTVKSLPKLELCFIAVQNEEKNAPLLSLHRRTRDIRDQFAFGFKRKDGCYHPMVSGEQLILEKNPPSLTDAYWFEREDVHSDHYHLQTVVTPKRCLRLKKGEKRVVLNETGDSIEIQHTSNMNKQASCKCPIAS
ncbi:uncharacterized protein LOC144386230 [Gasterosteus aculeatus]